MSGKHGTGSDGGGTTGPLAPLAAPAASGLVSGRAERAASR
ncbi:hypothetical protein ABZ926_26125 [Streptomyces litmocidini]